MRFALRGIDSMLHGCYTMYTMRRPEYDRALLARWIDDSGLTDEEFARRAGVSRMTVHRARTQHVDIESLGFLARACGHTLSEILTPESANRFAIPVSIT